MQNHYTSEIIQLYRDVLDAEEKKHYVSKNNFKYAIKLINEAYAKNPDWQTDFTSKTTDFNNAAHRCAYLHKYAMVHTGLMCEILQLIFQQRSIEDEMRRKSELSLCSLGGGPGTEIVSLLFVIRQIFGFIRCNINIIDYSLEWKKVFESIVAQLRSGRYGSVKEIVSSWYFSYDYQSADLLNTSYYNMYKVRSSIKNADIITMIKFISAAACDKTRDMVMKIFETMKPGGMLLFVDNAAGGFDKMVRDTAQQCGMTTVFGPLMHYDYENPFFALERHGHTSQFKTRVSIQMWKKPLSSPYNATAQLRQEYFNGPRRSTRPPQDSSRNIYINERHQPQRDSGCCSII